MSFLLTAVLVAQQAGGLTSPPSGDTAGYWQQRVHYRVAAVLDEEKDVLSSTANVVYVNNSPDTLREIYVHQYLNAFRPGSKWSEADEREGRVRYQNMTEPDYGYERFTSLPTVDDTPVSVEYPGAPDSTVARLRLPQPLPPRDSILVHFEWDARPSTLPRRQGRRGRHYDFAQWYPKVAVYDRGGWQHNALRPAGEFYGEFGTYDVTMILANDQVVAATGVPVEGDPGWRRVLRWGAVHEHDPSYAPGSLTEGAPRDSTLIPAGFRRVRFFARNVHHFAWTTSPDYMYEGGVFENRIGIHVLYRPGDEAQWGDGKAVQRTAFALGWLESIYGPYPYPQVSNVHRLDGGGTEFPMIVMNGSASQGLILHEVGHIFTYGILANNEWRDGWLDEGFTSYQTSWAQSLTLHDRAQGKAPQPPPQRAKDYRANAVRPLPHENTQIAQYRLDLTGRAEPIGTTAHEFTEFAIYNSMIYTRAEMMYGALRDVLGDSAFKAFLRLYYDRWKLKHVDERAIRSAAEDASGQDLDWFFEQWVRRTGLIDYALADVTMQQVDSEWVTKVRVEKRGEYFHAMPVGARISRGWIVVRGDPRKRSQVVEIRTSERPSNVRLDPHRVTEDWDRRNDVTGARILGMGRDHSRTVFDWPFLDQSSRGRSVIALLPLVWYSDPGGTIIGGRARSNYQGWIDRYELGVGVASRRPDREVIDFPEGPLVSERSKSLSGVQFWTTFADPRLRRSARPMIGVSGGVWLLDGVLKLDARKTWDDSRFLFAAGPRGYRTVSITATAPYDATWLDPARWNDVKVLALGAEYGRAQAKPDGLVIRTAFDAGIWDGTSTLRARTSQRLFGRAQVEVKKTALRGQRQQTADLFRFYLGISDNVPRQVAIGVSALDATETFSSNYYRPRGAPLARRDVHYVPLGGGGLRGYSPLLRTSNIAAVNLETARVVGPELSFARGVRLWASLFGDAGMIFGEGGFSEDNLLADAGAGVALRGTLFDREIRIRADFPVFVRQPALATGENNSDAKKLKFRWTFSFNDFW